jgi:hypothetical protein
MATDLNRSGIPNLIGFFFPIFRYQLISETTKIGRVDKRSVIHLSETTKIFSRSHAPAVLDGTVGWFFPIPSHSTLVLYKRHKYSSYNICQ